MVEQPKNAIATSIPNYVINSFVIPKELASFYLMDNTK